MRRSKSPSQPPKISSTAAMFPIMAFAKVCGALGRPTLPVQLMMRRMNGSRVPREFRGYEPDEGDVFVTTFAKSGTNWTMQIAVQIAHRGHAHFDHIHELVPWPESPIPVAALEDPGPRQRAITGMRVIKTHADAPLVPYSARARYITVIRDPKEVAVSGYWFIGGMLGLLDRMSFDQWYEHMLDDGPLLEGWARHTASFWAWRSRPNVLVLNYRDMKADLPGAVTQIATLMGVSLTEQEHAQVVHRASLPYMKANQSQFAPPRMPLRGGSAMPKMVRRGESGASDELLSAARQVAIDQQCRARLRALGCELPYDAMFETATTEVDSR